MQTGESEGQETGVGSKARATPQCSSHPASSIQSRPILVLCLHCSLILFPPPLSLPHPALPTPSTPPTVSRIEATRDTATVLLLFGKTKPLSAETGRTRGLTGWLCLDLTGPQALAPVQAQHNLCLVTESVHICLPTRALAKACTILTIDHSAPGLLKSCGRESGQPKRFCINNWAAPVPTYTHVTLGMIAGLDRLEK